MQRNKNSFSNTIYIIKCMRSLYNINIIFYQFMFSSLVFQLPNKIICNQQNNKEMLILTQIALPNQDLSLFPIIKPEKSPETNLIQSKKAKSIKHQGYWTISEKVIYLQFLIEFKHLFKDQQSRRRYKVFKRLADKLVGRDSEQCRRHHQEYQSKYGNDIDTLINFLRLKLQREIRIANETKRYQNEQKREELNCNQMQAELLQKKDQGWYIIQNPRVGALKVTIESQSILEWGF